MNSQYKVGKKIIQNRAIRQSKQNIQLRSITLAQLSQRHSNKKEDMLVGASEEDMQSWRTQMKVYQKSKRTKKPFGKEPQKVERVTEKDVKLTESKFNPILQTFKDPASDFKATQHDEQQRARSLVSQLIPQHLAEQNYTSKYEKPYDIINLYPYHEINESEPMRKNHAPLRNNYNIVSNQLLPEFYFKNSELRMTRVPEKKLLHRENRQFDIITNSYFSNDERRKHEEEQKQKEEVEKKYWKTHQFNPVIGSFYDSRKEEQYQEALDKQMKEHGRDVKLPPSYVNRERFIPDPSKEIPEEVKMLDEKYKNAKKRFQMKYIVEREYADRNWQHDTKMENILRNRVHDAKVLEDQTKEFNIVNNKPYDMNYKLELFGKKPMTSTWDKITKTKQASVENTPLIKTGGFN